MKWQKIVDRLEVEAAQVIDTRKPTPDDEATMRATMLIAAAKRLRQAAAAGSMDVALNEFVEVADTYKMMLLADRSPTFVKNATQLALKASNWDLSEALYQNLERSSISQTAAIAAGHAKAIPQDTIDAWQAKYEQLLADNPRFTKASAARIIAGLPMAKGSKFGTIRQLLKAPSHKVEIRGQISS